LTGSARFGNYRWNEGNRSRHLASRDPAGSHPPNPIPQTVGGSLQLGCLEPRYEPIRRPIARLGILTHVGRKSGKLYRTLVNVFRATEGFLIALTYGRESEWVRNVLAAGGCELETRHVCCISAPIIVHGSTRRRSPLFVGIVLRLIGANDFMQLSTSPASGVTAKFR